MVKRKKVFYTTATINLRDAGSKFVRIEQLPALEFETATKSGALRKAAVVYRRMYDHRKCSIKRMGPPFPKTRTSRGGCVIFVDVEEA